MIRLLISLVTVGAVVGCQVEDTETTSGTLNVDPNSGTVVPDWVTFADVDLNRDGTVDIADLVIVSKFFGQDAPESDIASASDESNPCREIRMDQSISDVDFMVRDSSRFKEFFEASDGDRYVYALLATRKIRTPARVEGEPDAYHWRYAKHLEPNCLALKLTVGLHETKTIIKEIRIKGVTRDGSSVDRNLRYSNDTFETPIWKMQIPGDDNSEWTLTMLFVKNDSVLTSFLKKSIPLGNESYLAFFQYGRPHPNELSYKTDLMVYHDWSPFNEAKKPFMYYHPDNKGHEPGAIQGGVYVNMLPSEVRSKYFPEDVEATGN